jgi:hypothetical protein
MAGEIHPDAITHGKVLDVLPERVDDTRTVLVRSYLRKRRRCTVAGTKPRLPVGGVDAGDDDVDTDLAGPWFGQIAIDELQNRRVTCARVNDRLHVRDNRVIFVVIPAESFREPDPDRMRSGCGGRASLFGMTRVLITGMSGTGKSAALAELARRGHRLTLSNP